MGVLLFLAVIFAVVGLWPVSLLLVVLAVMAGKAKDKVDEADEEGMEAAVDKDLGGCLAAEVKGLIYFILLVGLVVMGFTVSMGVVVRSEKPVPAYIDRLVPER